MGTMTKTEIARRKIINWEADLEAAQAEVREAGKRYFEAEVDSREERIAWSDLQWANTKVKKLEARWAR